MCGIIGAAGKLTAKHEKIFADLLTICQFRGRHSTGVVAVKRNDEVKYVKEEGTPERLLDSKTYDKLILGGLNKVLIGHCRHATAGKLTRANAHPFDYDEVIGVHNGTLKDWRYKASPSADGFDVDSEWLYASIAENGVQDTIQNLHKDGAWALSFWNKQNNTLNFIRNNKRPLVFAWSEDKEVMWWASEGWMLYAVERLDSCAVLNKDTGVWQTDLPVDTLWSWEIDASKTKEKVFVGKQVRKIEAERSGYAPPANPTTTTMGRKTTTPPTATGGTGFHKPGGSRVNSPFRPAQNPESLDDEIPLLGKREGLTPDGKTNTAPSTTPLVGFASNTSGSTTGQKSSRSERRPLLSLVHTSSNTPPRTNKNASSRGCENSSQTSQPSNSDVSFRIVAGIPYISSKRRGLEMTEEEFTKRTNDTCAWCKEKVEDLNQVHTILGSGDKFVCNSCATTA